jgi:integrase
VAVPGRKAQTRMLPHISPDTINAAFYKRVWPLLTEFEHFTLHDLRRTARTHLEAIGVAPHVAERCLNHSVRGLVGVYNRYDYLDERRSALESWANFIDGLNVNLVRG